MKIALRNIAQSAYELDSTGVRQPGALVRFANLAFPAKLAWRITRIAEAAMKEADAVEKQRLALVKRFDDENKDWRKDINKLIAFQSEHSELLDEIVELPGESLNPDDLGDALITPADLSVLGWLFEAEEIKAEQPQAEAESQPAKAKKLKAA